MTTSTMSIALVAFAALAPIAAGFPRRERRQGNFLEVVSFPAAIGPGITTVDLVVRYGVTSTSGLRLKGNIKTGGQPKKKVTGINVALPSATSESFAVTLTLSYPNDVDQDTFFNMVLWVMEDGSPRLADALVSTTLRSIPQPFVTVAGSLAISASSPTLSVEFAYAVGPAAAELKLKGHVKDDATGAVVGLVPRDVLASSSSSSTAVTVPVDQSALVTGHTYRLVLWIMQAGAPALADALASTTVQSIALVA